MAWLTASTPGTLCGTLQEFASGGDLFEALKHQPSMVFNEATAVARFMAPCLDALAYLQDRVSRSTIAPGLRLQC